MNFIWNFYKAHKFGIAIFFILLIAFSLRFYRYFDRWGLAYDQAHDAIVARYALEHYKLPLVGPFSSAGPFQTGGEWYWIIMIATSFYPKSIVTPWMVLTFLYVLLVYAAILVGKEFVNKKFGLLMGLLTAFSTAQIAQSTNLTNQTPLAIVSFFAMWSTVKYVRLKKLKYLFFLSFLVSLATTIHLQGILLFTLLFSMLIFNGKPNLKIIGIILIGIIIPLIPLLIFDIQNDFINGKNMLHYYLYDQYKISLDVLGRRWLTYMGIFWPNAWSHIIGGNAAIGWIAILGMIFSISYSFLKKELRKEWIIIILSFVLSVIVMRYTRTPLYESYTVFLHPFVLLLTGWSIRFFCKLKKSFGILLLIIIIGGSMLKNIGQIKNADNYTDFEVRRWVKMLATKLPNSKIAMYDYKYRTTGKSLPLVLYLNNDKKISDDGLKLGMVYATKSGQLKYRIVVGDEIGYQMLDLSALTSEELKKDGWEFVNPSEIYRTTEQWNR